VDGTYDELRGVVDLYGKSKPLRLACSRLTGFLPQLLSLALPFIYAIPVFDIFVTCAAHDWLWWCV
jgi:hypothetical protein